MPKIKTADGTNLYYEESGIGTPVIFVHEFAGDYRTWEPQMRAFSRSHRCVTYSQRGYPPSDIPSDPARYGQDIACSDVIAVMDGLGIKKAHVVGHSMGAYTALHVGIHHPDRCHSSRRNKSPLANLGTHRETDQRQKTSTSRRIRCGTLA